MVIGGGKEKEKFQLSQCRIQPRLRKQWKVQTEKLQQRGRIVFQELRFCEEQAEQVLGFGEKIGRLEYLKNQSALFRATKTNKQKIEYQLFI